MIEEAVGNLKQFYTDFQTSGKFIITGLTGVIVDNAVLLLSHSYLGWPLALSKVLSTESAILTNFAINDNWTFNQEDKPGNVWRRLLKSNSIRLFGLGVSVIILLTLEEQLQMPLILANLISIGFGFIFNYTLESFAWKMHET
ncbi:MAG: GtrA family protein [Candidatus Nanosalina sp.]